MSIKDYEAKDIPNKENIGITFLYKNTIGRFFLNFLIKRPISQIFGFLVNTSISRFFIKSFIKKNHINMDDYKAVKYKSFNDFFIREIKEDSRIFSKVDSVLSSPCDGKLTAYNIDENSVFEIKNSTYSLEDLLEDRNLARKYNNGVCLIFRLTPDDYHRYSYIDEGVIISQKKINGVLHTVRPISYESYNVYKMNSREYTLMKTKNFGNVIQIEVGALFVGCITNDNKSREFKRGEQKGMFQFGGSTIVMLFEKNSIVIDESIYRNTQDNKETIVKMGYKIGEKLNR